MTSIQVYDIGSAEPTTIDAADETRISEAVEVEHGDVLVLVDETDQVANFDRVDVNRTVGEVANGKANFTIFRSPLTQITVHVSYAGLSTTMHVHAATRIRRIRALAVKALGLDEVTAADTSLRLEGSAEDLPLKRPIGGYLVKGQHDVSLDLVHKVRPQG